MRKKKKTYPPFFETSDGGILSAGNIERIRRRLLVLLIAAASSAGLSVVVVVVPAVRRALKETHITVAGEMAPSDFSLHSLLTTHTSHYSLHYHWFTITMRNRIFKQTIKHTLSPSLSQIWNIFFSPDFPSLFLHFLTRQTEIRVTKKKKKEKKENQLPLVLFFYRSFFLHKKKNIIFYVKDARSTILLRYLHNKSYNRRVIWKNCTDSKKQEYRNTTSKYTERIVVHPTFLPDRFCSPNLFV